MLKIAAFEYIQKMTGSNMGYSAKTSLKNNLAAAVFGLPKRVV
jgi:hypothetical protein